jgi:5'(3')-deoxyribonucleotidase
MSLRNKIINLFEAHDLFDQQGSINVDHGEIGNRDQMGSMWHSYPSIDYAMLEDGEKPRIYIDMDSVLCDFVKSFKEKVGISPEEYEATNGKNAFWDIIESWGEDFWETLPWMPDGKELWNYVSKYNPIILSAAMAGYQRRGKSKWLQKEIGYSDTPIVNPSNWKGQSKVIFHKDKWRFILEKNEILIDDTESKIEPWHDNGGIGILHTSAKNTIEYLKKIGL